MDKVKHINTCSECEHFGNGAFPVVKYYVDGEMKSKFMGFSDRPNGKAIEHFAHKCNVNTHTLVYDNSEGCKDFTPKTWKRPLTCRDCSCFKHYYDDYSFFTCENFPFNGYHKNNDKACPNGKMQKDKTYTIFDFIK